MIVVPYGFSFLILIPIFPLFFFSLNCHQYVISFSSSLSFESFHFAFIIIYHHHYHRKMCAAIVIMITVTCDNSTTTLCLCFDSLSLSVFLSLSHGIGLSYPLLLWNILSFIRLLSLALSYSFTCIQCLSPIRFSLRSVVSQVPSICSAIVCVC